MGCINIQNKCDCCGCGACVDTCPKSCIKMEADEEGFVYPVVDLGSCVSCGKCITACPVIGAEYAKNKMFDDVAYAYVSTDNEVIRSSSSGGAFSLIMDGFAERYDDYVIVGAAFDGLEVRHIAVSDRASAEIFKKSKYIQSNTQSIYRHVKGLLSDNKAVLFSGTPCQVAALKCYLGHDYDNLLTVDIVCHGVPGQVLFEEYLTELESKMQSKVVATEFKYKRGFDGDSTNPRTIRLIFENGDDVNMDISESEYLYAYYTGLIYQPSCETCKFAAPERPGDITLGDYWGIEKMHPQLNSLKGVSLVRFNTPKGKFLVDFFREKGVFIETSWNFACDENFQLRFPVNPHRNRNRFFKLRSKGVSFCDNVNICKKPDNLLQKVFRKFCTLFDIKF